MEIYCHSIDQRQQGSETWHGKQGQVRGEEMGLCGKISKVSIESQM